MGVRGIPIANRVPPRAALAAPGILTGTIIVWPSPWRKRPFAADRDGGLIRRNPPEAIASGLMDPNSAMPAQIYRNGRNALIRHSLKRALGRVHHPAGLFDQPERHRVMLRRRLKPALVRMRRQRQ